MQAERDLTSKVKHDSTHEIKNKLSVTVIDSDYLTTVKSGKMVNKVAKLCKVEAGEILLKVGGSSIHIQKQSMTLEVGGTKIDLLPILLQLKAETIKLN